MGVPSFFRWLSRKYPKIISPVIEEESITVDGVELPCDYTKPNPNGELDNLYLDMNGIVHPCTHPEGREAPATEDEMMLEVFKYTDRVVSMARPRKVLMMAVDGVAPRAKMNQQRSRRFKAAQDAKLQDEAKQQAMEEAEARGEAIDDAIKGKKAWDTNVITPGTPFMDTLAMALRYWVAYKMHYDPGWKDLKVIISDATVPGEGEHKIMEFIRSQRSDAAYNPNTTHCIYGLDADLIFLGLATHEPHFRILREDVFAKNNKNRSRPPALTAAEQEVRKQEEQVEQQDKVGFIWLHIDILREYLEVELFVPRLPFTYDFERSIDDWVFLCFFCGNDFLPHLPCLDVRDNSIDMLTSMWKRSLPSMKGYMTADGEVILDRVEVLLRSLGQQEDNIFRKRREGEVRQRENAKRRKMEKDQQRAFENQMLPPSAAAAMGLTKNKSDRAPVHPLESMPLYTTDGKSVGSVHMTSAELAANRAKIAKTSATANKSAAQALKAQLSGESVEVEAMSESNTEYATEVSTPASSTMDLTTSPSSGSKRKAGEALKDDDDEPNDNIRFWEAGYRDRYYEQKFHVAKDDLEFRREVTRRYVEGVCWVLLYYYQGCPSWNWYYPYHYAPFAQEFVNLSEFTVEFNGGKPFRPYEQLMSVLPAASDHALPEPFRPLMSDPDSEIIDFYPEKFPIDMNGKKLAWQGIPLLPFIDEERLLGVVQKKYPELTDDEVRRNTAKEAIVLISCENRLYPELSGIYRKDNPVEVVETNGKTGFGLTGKFTHEKDCRPGRTVKFPLVGDMPDLINSGVVTVEFEMPTLKILQKSMLLAGVKLRDPPILTGEDKDKIMNSGGRRYQRKEDNNQHKANFYGGPTKYSFMTRKGGYKYYVHETEKFKKNQPQHGGPGIYNQQTQRGGYGYQGRGSYNNSYGGHSGYRGGYSQGGTYHQGHNQGYNQGGHHQGYHQGGTNQGGGYNQGGYNQGYNGYGYNQGGGYQSRSNNYDGQRHNEFQRQPGRGGYNSRGRGGYGHR
ncbi:5'-3' exoribonuclease 2 [Trichomonascus vanleenenianus]|uniref:ssRNA exonuclease RAT1 n=1 Tax=Trichomonascus vanleenenianus TaxID=2268995 RepID=UPI003ECA58A7